MASGSATQPHGNFVYRAREVPEPITMEEALSSQHTKEWKEASHLDLGFSRTPRRKGDHWV